MAATSEDHHEVKIGTARLKNEKRAGKADKNGRQAPDADAFAKEQRRGGGDHQRHCLQHCPDGGDRHIGQRQAHAKRAGEIADIAKHHRRLSQGREIYGVPLQPHRPQKTSDEPMPSMIMICPTGRVRLAILISRSARVKHPIAAIIRIMLAGSRRAVRAGRPRRAGLLDVVTHGDGAEWGGEWAAHRLSVGRINGHLSGDLTARTPRPRRPCC